MEISPNTIDQDRKTVFYSSCKDLDSLKFSLKKIDDLCKKGASPLIFIDGHGDKEKGIELCSGEFMSWPIFLCELRKIVNSACGDLTVVSALCHSMSIESMVPLGTPLPFSFYYGYQSEISAGEVESEGRFIYESLLRDGGESILKSKTLKLSCYSEYDHANMLVCPALLLALNPAVLSQKLPGLSKRNIRSILDKGFAQMGIPLSNIRVHINQAMRSEGFLEQIINSSMHDTERRRRYTREVISHFQNMKRHHA